VRAPFAGPQGGQGKRPALVLKLFHQCGLGVARSLGRLGIPVYGVHDDLRGPVPSSRYLRHTFEWDLDREPPERSVEYLCELAGRLGDRPLLIATDDVTSLLVDDHAERLGDHYTFAGQPPGLARELASKKGMFLLCRKHGVPTPDAYFPESRDEVVEFSGRTEFPVVLKGIDPGRMTVGGGPRVAIANDAGKLLALHDELEDPAAPNLMLQEYIPGGEDSVWMFNGYFDGTSECKVAFSGKKIRQYPAYAGMSSLAICLRNEQVERDTKDFMKAIGYRGILDIGWRFDARDGQYKLLDVNPRVGATFRLFIGTNGIDVVRALYLDMAGEPVPSTTAREGRKWMVENYDLASSLRHFRDRNLTVREWARSIRGVEELAWFSVDDPAPFARMAWKNAATAVRRSARRPPQAGAR
jgi:D-aspartate ligase